MPITAWNPNLYDTAHGFVTSYGADVLTLLDPQAGERILDVGCGTGHHVKTLADGGVEAVGIDSSPAMIAAAQQHYPALRFAVADASDFAFEAPFDAVFSNAALHWVMAAEASVVCIAKSLRDGGRFVAEMGGAGNIAAIVAAVQRSRVAHGYAPIATNWYFPSIATYTTLLEKHGLEAQLAVLINRPTPLNEGENGLRTWLTMFGASLLHDIAPDQQAALVDDIEATLRPTLFRDGVWYADYRRLRFVAIKQGLGARD